MNNDSDENPYDINYQGERVLNQPDDFVFSIKTSHPGTSGDLAFEIPTHGTGYSYDVDCNNDGVNEAAAQTSNYTCTYAAPGSYTIRISGSFPRIYFNNEGDRLKILSIDQWGTGAWTSMANAFYGCENLVLNASDTPNFSAVTDISHMFDGADVLGTGIGIGDWNWNTSNITNISCISSTVS